MQYIEIGKLLWLSYLLTELLQRNVGGVVLPSIAKFLEQRHSGAKIYIRRVKIIISPN